ncbi:MAG: response regulator [Fibrobacterales bacterium]
MVMSESEIKTKRLLIIDDQWFIRQTIEDMAKDYICRNVSSVGSADIALELIQKKTFDLLLVDLEMKGVNGLEFIKQIRSDKTRQPADTRIIIMTSHSEREILGSAIALDINGFIVKPCLLPVLKAKVFKAFDEGFSVRSPLAYEIIATNIISDSSVKTEEPEGEEPASEKEPQESSDTDTERLQEPPSPVTATIIENGKEVEVNVLSVSIDTLEEGMQLSSDIRFNNGEILLKSGASLSQQMINRIKELKDNLPESLTITSEGV